MSAASGAPPPPTDGGADRLARLLSLAATLCVAFVLAFRLFSPGLQAQDPEGGLLALGTWVAGLFWIIGACLGGRLPLPRPTVCAGLLLYAATTALAVWRTADGGGEWQSAIDLAWCWSAEALLLLMIADTARAAWPYRLYLSALGGGAAATVVYSLYQRLVGLPYLRLVVAEDPAQRLALTGGERSSEALFAARLGGDRVFGPFSYPNSLAAYCLLVLPVAIGLLLWAYRRASADSGSRPAAVPSPPSSATSPSTSPGTFAGRFAAAWPGLVLHALGAGLLLILLWSGSKAGLLTAVLLTLAALATAIPQAHPPEDTPPTGPTGPSGDGTLATAGADGSPRRGAGAWACRVEACGRFLLGLLGSGLALAALAGGIGMLAGGRLPAWATTLGLALLAACWYAVALRAHAAAMGRLGLEGVESATPSTTSTAGWGLTVALILAGLLFLFGYAPAPEARGPVASVHREAWETLRVRGGYWLGAVELAAENPVRGVGLDNFGPRYPAKKALWAWETNRVHNHYLQLWVDGGVLLLLAFLLLWWAILRQPPTPWTGPEGSLPAAGPPSTLPTTPPTPTPGSTPTAKATPGDAEFIELVASWGAGLPIALGLLAYALGYWGRIHGLIGGLSIEYLLRELFAAPADRGGAAWLLAHGATHLLLLPLAWSAAALAVWRITDIPSDAPGSASESAPESLHTDAKARAVARLGVRMALAPWIRLGILAVLLHAVADFHLYDISISTYVAALAGLFLAGRMAARDALLPTTPPMTTPAALAMETPGLPPSPWPTLPRWSRPVLALTGALLFGAAILLWALPGTQGRLLRAQAASALRHAREQRMRPTPPRARAAAAKEAVTLAEEAYASRPWDPHLALMVSDARYELLMEDLLHQLPRVRSPEARLRYLQRALFRARRTDPERFAAIEAPLRRMIADLTPYSAAARMALARRLRELYPDQRDPLTEAAKWAQSACNRYPTHAKYHYELGQLLLNSGNSDQARLVFQKSLELHHDVDDMRIRLTESEVERAKGRSQTSSEKSISQD